MLYCKALAVTGTGEVRNRWGKESTSAFYQILILVHSSVKRHLPDRIHVFLSCLPSKPMNNIKIIKTFVYVEEKEQYLLFNPICALLFVCFFKLRFRFLV